jgi:REP element-mobilizing transposase RayT
LTYARKSLISLKDTPFYHCVARCVRRAWLWGKDEFARKDYSHRKAWVQNRLRQLSEVFTIDLCAYAVMSNHYHVILHVDQRRATSLTAEDVVARWSRIYRVPPPVERWLQGSASEAEAQIASGIVELWRARLSDISWYMRCLNEYLSRRANIEDGCEGRFWQGRFKSQALLDEAGLLTAMAYVDLNPVRAGIAATPEVSDFTSVFDRVERLVHSADPTVCARGAPERPPLMEFHDGAPPGQPSIPFTCLDYLALLDWTGRGIRSGKRGTIDAALPAIAERLSIDAEAWSIAMTHRGNVFGRALGRLDRMRLHALTLGQSWIRGLRQSERLYRHELKVTSIQ